MDLNNEKSNTNQNEEEEELEFENEDKNSYQDEDNKDICTKDDNLNVTIGEGKKCIVKNAPQVRLKDLAIKDIIAEGTKCVEK